MLLQVQLAGALQREMFMEVARGVLSLSKFICWYTHARLKSSPTTEAEKSVLSSGLGVMLREAE